METNKPDISIIVSVYNAEKGLARCLESLVYQSLSNIEIIVVDKASTDGSWEIAQLYQRNFPDKVRIFKRPYSNNLAAAYNFAIPLANAEYVAFADADDWYELNAMELIYEQLQRRPVDMIHFAWKILDANGDLIRVAKHPQEETVEALLRSDQMCTYWCRVIKKSLICKYLPIPEVDGCDAYFLAAVMSNMSSICALDRTLYNYVAGIGETSIRIAPIRLKSIDGWNYLLEHCNPKYMSNAVYFIARRVAIVVRKYWSYKWEFLRWLKEHQELFLDNTLLQEDVNLNKKIRDLIETETDLIPQIIYLNGFDKQKAAERKQTIPDFVFCLGEGSIVVLDESNCDLENDHLKTAYQEGRYEYLGHYFALQKIYETGGFYVGEHIRFTASLAPILDKPSVFSYITTKTFSPEIWGGRPGNKVIRELLRTYEIRDFYGDPYVPLSERIKNILAAYCEIPLNGRIFQNKDVYVADSRMFVLNNASSQFVCEHDFSKCLGQDGYMVLPLDLACPTNIAADQEIRKLTIERNKLKHDLRAIYDSDSWKLIKRLKRFANSPVGRPFKRIFKFALRIYRKLKYDI